MRRHSGFLLIAIAAATTAACAEFKGLIMPGSPASQDAPAVSTPFSRTVSGQVKAAPGMTVQALSQAALVNAEVYLADGNGQPLPAMTTRTNDQGRFVFTNVPVGYTFLVVAKTRANGKEALLQTLVYTTEAGATADIDATSTLVSVGALQSPAEGLGKLVVEKFQSAVTLAAGRLQDGQLPDFSDRAAVAAKAAQLQQESADLKTAVEGLRTDLMAAKPSLVDVKAQLAKREAELAAIATAIAAKPKPSSTGTLGGSTSTETTPATPAPNEHAFFVYPGKFQSNDYPVNVEFRKKDTEVVTAKLTLTGDNVKVPAKVMHGEANDLWISTQRHSTYFIAWHGYTIADGAKRELALPFAEKENPLVQHTFKMPATKFEEGDFPVNVEFREKGGSVVIAKLTYKTVADKPAGKVRHGMEYDLWVSSKTQLKASNMWNGWSVPEGASQELMLPFN